MPAREALLSRTFVQLADTLVDEFDIIDLLTVLTDRCVELLGAAAAGILLADHEGSLHVMAASSEQVRLLELFQLQNHEGPCLDCFSTGHAAVNHNRQLSLVATELINGTLPGAAIANLSRHDQRELTK